MTLAAMEDDPVALTLGRTGVTGDADVAYALEFLGRARVFVAGLTADERGMAYLIG